MKPKTVWKFPIEITDVQILQMPHGAEIIHAGLDPQGGPCVWARVNPNNSPAETSLHISGTGHPVPDGDNRHVGSLNQGPCVWHLWTPC